MASATPALGSIKVYDLFGGAIKMALPANLIDASDIRQVPDTQEVWLTPTSDVSYIVEILERVDKDNGVDAVKFHFESLAHDNNATGSSIDELVGQLEVNGPSPPAQPGCFALVGSQMVPKFNKRAQQADLVRIYVAVWRVDAKNSDVVLSVNVPVLGGNEDSRGVGEEGDRWARLIWENAIKSFKIEDFGLFADVE